MLADEVSQLVESVLDQLEKDEAVALVSTLISAGSAVSEELTLESALRTIADIGRRLTGAKYGAIGVLSPAGVFERFIHVGMTATEIEAIGALPVGKGVLGAVVAEQHAMRFADLSSDAAASGLPQHHPAMHSFLGVPIYIDGVVYGNLYLTERARGGFTDLDEAVIVALAHIAGGAIANARKFQWEQMTSALSEHAVANSRDVLEGSLSAADFDSVVAEVADIMQCAVVVTQYVVDAQTVALAESGTATDEIRDIMRDAGRMLMRADELDVAAIEESISAMTPDPVIAVPFLNAHGSVIGSLVAVRPHNGLPFVDAERAMLASYARIIASSRELALSRHNEQRLTLTEERERIARDLHDHIIQSLFAIGLSIDGVVGRASPDIASRLSQQVDEIDTTIRKIRNTIFNLSQPSLPGNTSFRARIHTMVRQLLGEHGIDYRVEFEGPIDSLVGSDHQSDIEAVLRETIANIVRHANAQHAAVAVRVSPSRIRVEVSDDGDGLGDTTRRSGLANLAARAENSGGTCTITANEPRGTFVTWDIPQGEQ